MTFLSKSVPPGRIFLGGTLLESLLYFSLAKGLASIVNEGRNAWLDIIVG